MNVLAEKFRDLKYNYLMAQGVDGGDPQDFEENYVAAWLDRPESRDFMLSSLPALAKAMAKDVWGKKLSALSPDQLSLQIDGGPSPVELKYKDLRPKEQRVRGGYITVLTEFATIRQFGLAATESQRKANQSVAAAEKGLAQYELLLERSNGNEEALVVAHLDEDD
jgi:hypothetical protein